MSGHTQGHITFKADGDANHYSMLTEDGKWWLAVLANGEQTSERQVANFRRLAACWNACDGLDTKGLETQVKIGDSIKAMQGRAIDRQITLELQRNRLLTAAQSLADRGFFTATSCADSDTLKDMEAMRAAIASVTGAAS